MHDDAFAMTVEELTSWLLHTHTTVKNSIKYKQQFFLKQSLVYLVFRL